MIKMAKMTLIAAACLLTLGTFAGEARAQQGDLTMQAASLRDKARSHTLRADSLQAIARDFPEEAYPLLLERINDAADTDALRYLAATHLFRLNPDRAASDFTALLLDAQADGTARKMAMAELAQSSRDKLSPHLERFLGRREENPALRQYALALYAREKQQRAVPELREFAQNREQPAGFRAAALAELEYLGDKDFLAGALARIMRNEKEPLEFRKNAAASAARIGGEVLSQALAHIAVADHENTALRELALSSLAIGGNEAALPILQEALDTRLTDRLRESMRAAHAAIKERTAGQTGEPR